MEESSGDESDKVHPIYQIINTGFEKSPEKPYPFILPVTQAQPKTINNVKIHSVLIGNEYFEPSYIKIERGDMI